MQVIGQKGGRRFSLKGTAKMRKLSTRAQYKKHTLLQHMVMSAQNNKNVQGINYVLSCTVLRGCVCFYGSVHLFPENSWKHSWKPYWTRLDLAHCWQEGFLALKRIRSDLNYLNKSTKKMREKTLRLNHKPDLWAIHYYYNQMYATACSFGIELWKAICCPCTWKRWRVNKPELQH